MAIQSTQNQLIKDIAALKQKKHRDETGHILVEGLHPVEEALKAGLNLKHLFLLEGQPLPPTLQAAKAPERVTEKAMARMATTDSPPPVLAVFEKSSALARMPQGKNPFYLVLDSLQDPGNLGTLIRSAIAFGADAIILTPGSVEPFNPKVIRGSAGLVFAIPILEWTAEQLLKGLPEETAIYTAESDETATISYREADYTGACALVLGNEGHGIRLAFGNRKSLGVTIPMQPKVESLNVAVSGSIILAEARAQRHQKLTETVR